MIDHGLARGVRFVAGRGGCEGHGPADAHVHRCDRKDVGKCKDAFERGHLVRGERSGTGSGPTAKGTVEARKDLNRNQIGSRSNAGEALAGPRGNPGDVCAVCTVLWCVGTRGTGAGTGLSRAAVGTVVAGREARLGDYAAGEERVCGINAGIENRNGLAAPVVAGQVDGIGFDLRDALVENREG